MSEWVKFDTSDFPQRESSPYLHKHNAAIINQPLSIAEPIHSPLETNRTANNHSKKKKNPPNIYILKSPSRGIRDAAETEGCVWLGFRGECVGSAVLSMLAALCWCRLDEESPSFPLCVCVCVYVRACVRARIKLLTHPFPLRPDSPPHHFSYTHVHTFKAKMWSLADKVLSSRTCGWYPFYHCTAKHFLDQWMLLWSYCFVVLVFTFLSYCIDGLTGRLLCLYLFQDLLLEALVESSPLLLTATSFSCQSSLLFECSHSTQFCLFCF